MMEKWLESLVFLGLVCLRVGLGAPAESVKGKDEFVFLLPGASESGSKLYSGLPFSVELQPPFETTFVAAKDSYGNPVPAFNPAAGLPTEKGSKVVDAGGLKFEIPSYASGITDIRQPTDELLPPLTSEEQQADSLFSPEFNIPSVELLPPLSSDDNIFQNNPKDVSINEISNGFDAKTTVEPVTETGKTEPQDSEDEVTTTTVKYDGEKYTGGFGGAPGILGEQKNVGYAVKAKSADVEAEAEVEKLETTTANLETSTPTDESDDTTVTAPTTITTETAPLETRAPPTSAETTTAPPRNSHADEKHQLESSSTLTPSQDSYTDDTHQSESSSIPISSTESYGEDEHQVKSSSTTLLPTTNPQFTFDIIPQAPANDLIPPFLPTGPFAPVEEQPPTAFSQRFGFDKSAPAQKIPETDEKPIEQPSTFVLFPPEPEKQTIEPPNRILLTPFETPVIIPAVEIPSNTDLTYSPNSPQLPSSTSVPVPPESQPQPIEPPSTSILTQSQNSFFTPPSISIFTPPLPFPASPSTSLLTSPFTQAVHSSTLTPPANSPFPQKNLGGSFGFQGSSSISAQSPGSGAGKYSGGFGGAPGILGNQQKPGYAVQSDGTIKDPDHKYQPPVNQLAPIAVTRPPPPPIAPISPVQAPSSGKDKYTGGFGGPPGWLSPFDDQKRG